MTLEKVRRRVLEKVSGGFWGCDWAYEVYEKFADPIVEISRNKFYYGDF